MWGRGVNLQLAGDRGRYSGSKERHVLRSTQLTHDSECQDPRGARDLSSLTLGYSGVASQNQLCPRLSLTTSSASWVWRRSYNHRTEARAL